MSASRHTYVQAQVEAYFDRIALPSSERIHDVSSLSDQSKYDFLDLLQKHELVKVPWENLTQHYSWHRVVNVKPPHLFSKIVKNEGRGGYCMEANHFFHTILLSLGFDAYMAGARIHSPATGSYGGWTHVVNIVTVGEQRYLLDGGFGANGPSKPLLLKHDQPEVQVNPADMRVVYEALPQHRDRSQRVWIYQHRINKESDWVTQYCFTDTEFLPADIENMNFSPWLNPQSFFTHKVVATRFTTSLETDSEEGEPRSPNEAELKGEIDGAIIINHSYLKWRRHGTTVRYIEFQNEEDRVQALERYFGIVIAQQDREAIMGTAAQIGAAGGATG